MDLFRHMGVVDTIVSEVIKRVLNRPSSRRDVAAWSPEHLRPHLIEVVNWSRRVEFVGLAEARDTDRDTVALFMSLPRKFRGKKSFVVTRSEEDLATNELNIVLLGDPGAGKTTTLKRIARAVLDEPVTAKDTAEYPLVVRLREINDDLLLEELICRALGVPTARKELPHRRISQDSRLQSKWYDKVQIISDNRPALDVIAEIANDSTALLLLDGLDEVRPELRDRTENTVIQLARKCDRARIRLTCRSGDYSRPLEGFDSLELCPLDDSQVAEIVNRWCTSPSEFNAALSKLPFRDLASRPLFLCELIVLFEKSGFLPQQPSSVYRRIVILALEEWDRSKRVERRSRYAGFDPSRKFEFLASLAFHLTYVTEQKFFTSKSFASAYESIRHAFDLPSGEARQVFTELETHTGIMVESGFEQYEFSHLSLQEFLAADYLVRDCISKETKHQMLVNPAPLAISVAMSSNASQRLAAILLSPWAEQARRDLNFGSFFSRIAQEGTIFREDILLGFTALALLFEKWDESPFVQAFLSTPVVQKSIGLALKAYTARELADGLSLRLDLRSQWQVGQDLRLPRSGEITRKHLQPTLELCKLVLQPAERLLTEDVTFGDQYFFVNLQTNR